MNCTIEEVGDFARKLHVHIPAEDFDTQLEQRLRKLATTVKIKGFRPGKVPLAIIKQHYTRKVMKEVAQDMIRTSYLEVLEQKSLTPISSPQFDNIKVVPGQSIQYTANIEILSEVKLQTLDKVSIEKPLSEVSEENVDSMVERVRRNHGQWQLSEQAARLGDRLEIDLERQGLSSGDHRKQEFRLILGRNMFAPGFDKQLEGMHTNEEKAVEVSFPEAYRDAGLAGHTVAYTVQVKKIELLILPQLDQAFFKACGVEEGGLAALRALLREEMERELRVELKKCIRGNVTDALLQRNPIAVPKQLLSEKIEAMRKNEISNIYSDTDKKIDYEKILPDEIFRESAISRIRLFIIFHQIFEQLKLRVERQEFEDKLDEVTSIYQETDKVKDHYRRDPQAAQSIESMVLEDKVLEFLLSQAELVEKHYDFYQIVDHKP